MSTKDIISDFYLYLYSKLFPLSILDVSVGSFWSLVASLHKTIFKYICMFPIFWSESANAANSKKLWL